MKFDLVNPSDPYTLEADDLQVAGVACCLLGNGKYGLTGLGDDAGQDVPMFLLGGHDLVFQPSAIPVDVDDHVEVVINTILHHFFNAIEPGRIDFSGGLVCVLIP